MDPRIQQLRKTHDDAVHYYEKKVEKNNNNARYHNFLAALRGAEGGIESKRKSRLHYVETLRVQPHNVMARNDFALFIAKEGKYDDAKDELEKALLYNDDQPTIRKNLSAVLARKGNYAPAIEHATRASQINPEDAMNHRNLARIYEAMGDSRTSLQHNLVSINLEKNKPNTSAYRAAAVQIVAQGGNKAG